MPGMPGMPPPPTELSKRDHFLRKGTSELSYAANLITWVPCLWRHGTKWKRIYVTLAHKAGHPARVDVIGGAVQCAERSGCKVLNGYKQSKHVQTLVDTE